MSLGQPIGQPLAAAPYSAPAGESEQNNLTVIDPPRMMEFVGKMMIVPILGVLLHWWQLLTGSGNG